MMSVVVLINNICLFGSFSYCVNAEKKGLLSLFSVGFNCCLLQQLCKLMDYSLAS